MQLVIDPKIIPVGATARVRVAPGSGESLPGEVIRICATGLTDDLESHPPHPTLLLTFVRPGHCRIIARCEPNGDGDPLRVSASCVVGEAEDFELLRRLGCPSAELRSWFKQLATGRVPAWIDNRDHFLCSCYRHLEAESDRRKVLELLLQLYEEHAVGWAAGAMWRPHPHDQENILQIAALNAWKVLPHFTEESEGRPFGPYYRKIVCNAVKGYYHRPDRPTELPPDTPDPADEAERKDLFDAMYTSLDQLTAEHRQVLVCRFLEGMTLEAVAKRLGLSTTTAHRREQETLEFLRKQFERGSES